MAIEKGQILMFTLITWALFNVQKPWRENVHKAIVIIVSKTTKSYFIMCSAYMMTLASACFLGSACFHACCSTWVHMTRIWQALPVYYKSVTYTHMYIIWHFICTHEQCICDFWTSTFHTCRRSTTLWDHTTFFWNLPIIPKPPSQFSQNPLPNLFHLSQISEEVL